MRKQFNQEKLLKAQAVNKLAEIMNRKDMGNPALVNGKNKISSTELKRKEKECRKLQQELTQVRFCVFYLLTVRFGQKLG